MPTTYKPALAQVAALVEQHTAEGLKREAKKLVAELQAATPVQTGRLRSGWRVRHRASGRLVIENTQPYAPEVLARDRRLQQAYRRVTGREA